MRLTAQEIEQMKSVDIGAVDKETLADASGFTFDPMLPKETRAQRMLEHFKNPYCFRLGDMVIKLEFADEGPSLQELLTAFFSPAEKRAVTSTSAPLQLRDKVSHTKASLLSLPSRGII